VTEGPVTGASVPGGLADDQRPLVTAADDEGIARAARLLEQGRLVALPTETVYGLGARADDPDALARIFAAKGRPATNPLIAHVLDAEHARTLAAPGAFDERAKALAAAFWPGPLTLVLPRAVQGVPDVLTAGGETIALRAPEHAVFRRVLAAVSPRFAIAAPSANPSECASPTTAEHVAAGLGRKVDLILDGGPCRLGLESSVVSLVGPRPRLLRPGALSVAELRRILPDLEVGAPGTASAAEGGPETSPGQRARHYAPRAKLVLAGRDALVGAVASARARHGEHVGVVTRGPIDRDLPGPVRIYALPDDPTAYGSRLYATLHEADADGCTILVVDAPPADEHWLAVRDRLLRATR
jgi:L-threonylcarbamoyladenylate synthase